MYIAMRFLYVIRDDSSMLIQTMTTLMYLVTPSSKVGKEFYVFVHLRFSHTTTVTAKTAVIIPTHYNSFSTTAKIFSMFL